MDNVSIDSVGARFEEPGACMDPHDSKAFSSMTQKARRAMNEDLKIIRRNRRYGASAGAIDTESSMTMHRAASRTSKGMQAGSRLHQHSRDGGTSAMSTKDAIQPGGSSAHGRNSEMRSILLMKSQLQRRTAQVIN